MDVINAIQKAPDALQAVNDIVASLQSLATAISKFVRIVQGKMAIEAVPVEVVEGEPVKAIPAPETSGEAATPPPAPEKKPIAKADLRAFLMTKEKDSVKTLFGEFGVVKFSEIPESQYPVVMAKAKALPDKAGA